MKTLVVNRKIIVSIFSVIMLLTYSIQGISYAQDAPDDIVEFKDTNLAEAVRRALGLPTGDGIDLLKIPKAELDKLTKLTAERKNIVDLSGIEYATQLKGLDLTKNEIIDITPISQLTQLTSLKLWGNEIIDITPISQLTQLTSLNLGSNNISNITPLTQLMLLSNLDIERNLITDVTPLAQLTNLRTLSVPYNLITDVTPLAQLTGLVRLYLWGNPVRDITPLAQLTQRTKLYLPSFFGPIYPGGIKLLTVSTSQPLTSTTLDGGSVTLTLIPSWAAYDTSIDNIRNALTVSGIDGATVDEVIRVSDTELTVTFGFTGSLDVTTVLTLTLEAEAVSGFERRALTGKISVYPELGLTVSSNFLSSAVALNKSIVTLTLSSGAFVSGRYSIDNIRKALTISGIPGITFDSRAIKRVSDTVVTIELTFRGDIEKDTILTFTLGAGAIEDYNNGPPLTARLSVPAVTELRVLSPELQGQPMFWVNTGTGKIESSEYFDAITNEVTVLTVNRAAEKLYWGERSKSGGVIKRADFDGTNVEALVTLSNVPRGIVIDSAANKLYWTNSDLQIQTATLKGEDISTVIQLEEDILEETKKNCSSSNTFFFFFIPFWQTGGGCSTETVRINLTSPTDIAVNTADGRLYWTEFSGRIRRVNLDGTGLGTLLPEIGSPYGITVAGDKIYWAEEIDENSGKVQRANLNGTKVETLATVQGLPTGISIDTAAGKVYWANSLGGIQRTDLNGGEVEAVVSGISSPGDFVLIPGAQPTIPTTPETPAITGATVSISPTSVASPAVGEQITFNLNIAGGETVAGYQATVQFDDTALRYVSGANGDFLPAGAFFVPPVIEGNLVKLNAASLAGESNGDGTFATLTFEVIAVKASTLTLSDVLLTNSAGEAFVPTIENAQITETTQLKGDINGDGIVNIQDLVLVAGRLGQTGTNSADVNGDGIVNIQDLVLVAGALGTSASAPSLNSQALEMLTAAEVKQWLSHAQQLNLTDATSKRGILFLQHLLATLTPKETTLLANFPNPFNPETWIPYQLAKDTNVTLHIYAMNGTLVRTLTLGHQAAGMYQTRSRAAYWDGKNALGEPVASGVYFYTLTADDFSATRKMLIQK